MDLKVPTSFIQQFDQRIRTIDSHTAGEPTRLVIGGIGELPGESMRDKRQYFIDHLDPIRKRLTREPCGHTDMFTAVLTDPVTEGAKFGLIYMDPRRYPFLCGHATIAAASTLIDAGLVRVPDGENSLIVDTPSGPMTIGVKVDNERTEAVTLQMVPSFVYNTGEILKVPEFGEIEVETVCVGGFFTMVNASQLDIALKPENSARLIKLGMELIDLSNEQLTVAHPERPEVKTVDVVEFYEDASSDKQTNTGIVIYGESHMDRSPCGTGTTAKMTLLHHLGHLKIGEDYINSGPLGTTFKGRLVHETFIGEQKAVVAEITSVANITGFHTFVLDDQDPFPEGYLL